MSNVPDIARLPGPGEAAFLLDFDGTLVDLAPTPDAVVVPPSLVQALHALRGLAGDALAVVTGRPIAQIDRFLPGIPFAVAGEHGIAIRHRPDAAIERAALPALPAAWLDEADRLVAAHPGSLVERKQTGLVLHFRGAPGSGTALKQAVEGLLSADPAHGFHLQAAKMAWEIKPDGVDKGSAVRRLMQDAPFLGRQPIFIGDDVTDEDGIRAAQAMGGLGFRIPDDFSGPDAVRAWLGRLAQARPGATEWAG